MTDQSGSVPSILSYPLFGHASSSGESHGRKFGASPREYLYLTCRYLLLRGRILRISSLQQGGRGVGGKGGRFGLYFITYTSIALEGLVAAIKSFWFETARGSICAFFFGNKPTRSRYTWNITYGVELGCRWVRKRGEISIKIDLSLPLSKPKLNGSRKLIVGEQKKGRLRREITLYIRDFFDFF